MYYIHQYPDWTNFRWDNELLLPKLASVRNLQGQLLGKMRALDTALRDIQDLLNKNVLRKENGGGRSSSYIMNAC